MLPAIRSPAVAGTFYPAEPDALRSQLRAYLGVAQPAAIDAAAPKAIIVPHAGYSYSAPVAATAYRLLQPLRSRVRRVVLLGPAHRVPVAGLALPGAQALATPLGTLRVDQDAVAQILRLPQVTVSDLPHREEHSLEVQLPFLQEVLGEFSLVPLVVGDATGAQVQQVLEQLWGGPETLIVISSDLSHYHDSAAARAIDSGTAAAIERLQPEAIGFDQTCGRTPLEGLLRHARRAGMRIERLDLRNSGDTAGPPDRVVGYGAWALYEMDNRTVAPDDRERLHRIARESIRHGLARGCAAQPDPARFPAALSRHGASFVTLKKAGELRGCVGSLEAVRSVVEDVAHNAWAAAFADPRFPAVTREETRHLALHISLLGEKERLHFEDEAELLRQLRPGTDGLVIREGARRATFLPQVWAALSEPEGFLHHLKMKAGMPDGHWSDRIEAWRYTVEEF
ncbi:MAG: AmmeMemoRadiSam system protein B [Pseudomonadota bacterium]|nr:AmmeMemoRadiSam system protein B [Pseudomonadota bacterium]